MNMTIHVARSLGRSLPSGGRVALWLTLVNEFEAMFRQCKALEVSQWRTVHE